MELVNSIKNTVVSAFNAQGTSTPHVFTKSEVIGLEENERSRRITQVSQTNVDKRNAANISGLITTQSFPIFRGNVSKGYKRVTTKYEDEERRRRLTNKSESALRRANANKTSRMIQELGWPFYQQRHSGPEYFVMDPTKLLEEEEREWRTSDSYWGPTAKHNAAMVANILRWSNFKPSSRAGFRQHIKYLSERERQYRMADSEFAAQNAYNEALLIKQMGPPFYVQEALGSKRDFSEINRLEEQERKRRMASQATEQLLARELAGIVGSALASVQGVQSEISQSDAEVEEQERGRRMTDVRQQNIARQNAKQVSLMVRESSQNKLQGAGPMWFSISRNSMRALEEIERTRRLRDIEGQRYSRQQAKLISDMITGRIAAPARLSSHTIMEEERQSRLFDRQLQQVQIKNARKVSGLIARHMLMSSGSRSFALALEESERTRRLQDQNQQALAIDNARKVSSLVSTLNVAPGNRLAQQNIQSTEAPIAIAPVSAHTVVASPLPVYTAPVPVPVAVDMPSTPIVAAPIVSAPTPIVTAPITSAPITSTPISSTPITSTSFTPITSTPISSAPITSAPIYSTSAPITSAPITTTSAPIASTPVTNSALPAPFNNNQTIITPLVYLGTTAPVPTSVSAQSLRSSAEFRPAAAAPSIQPMVLPATNAPVPVAPLASAVPIARGNSFNAAPAGANAFNQAPTVPIDVAAISHASLGERERKRLIKQAEKLNKRSEKEVRKAERSMLKAEKLHQKGRDDKALKLENKAGMLMKNAEHERKWASGIHGELHNTPAPASM